MASRGSFRSPRTLAAVFGARIAASGRVRAVRLLFETSKGWSLAVTGLMAANAVLPILVLVALGLVIGDLPAAIRQGMSSAGGHRLELALAFTCVAYLANLLLGPYQDILTLVVRTRLNDDLQARLMAAVSEPTGVAHLEDPALLDKLAWATGELLNVQPSDAPVTLALVLGNMLTGIIACAVLGAFRWWLGLAMLAVWLLARVPLQATMRGQVAQYRGGTDVFRRAYYFLHTALGSGAAKELRVFGLSDWIVGEYRQYWAKAAKLSHQGRKRFIRTYLGLFVPVLLAYVGGSAAVAWAGFHHEIGLGEVTIMLVMLVTTSQVGALGRNELVLQQMVTALPDVDELVRELRDRGAALAGTRPAAGLPEREVRFERVSFRYPRSDQEVLSGLDLVLPTGRSTAIVGLNGAGKTTLVKLLSRLHDPTAGAIVIDGLPLTEIDPGFVATAGERRQPGLHQVPPLGAGERGLRLTGPPRRRGRDHRGGPPGRGARPHRRASARLGHRAVARIHRRRGPVGRAVAARGAGPCAVRDQARRPRAGPRRAHRLARRPGRGRVLRPFPGDHRRRHHDRDLAPFLHGAPRRADLRARRRTDRRTRNPRGPGRQRRTLRRDVPHPGRPVRRARARGSTYRPRARERTRAGGGTVNPPWHVRLGRRLYILFFYGFAAGPFAMTLGVIVAAAAAVASVSYTIGLKVVIDAIAASHGRGVAEGTLLVGVLFAVSWTLNGLSAMTAFYIGNLCTGYLSSRVARLTTTISGLEHHERPEYLKQLDLLQRNLYTLSNAPTQNLLTLLLLVRLATVVVLLATVDPILALLPLLVAFPLVGDDLAARRRMRTDQALVERRRLANGLFSLASTPAQASELRSFGLRAEIARRHQSLNEEVRRQVIRSVVIGALESGAGWVVYGQASPARSCCLSSGPSTVRRPTATWSWWPPSSSAPSSRCPRCRVRSARSRRTRALRSTCSGSRTTTAASAGWSPRRGPSRRRLTTASGSRA